MALVFRSVGGSSKKEMGQMVRFRRLERRSRVKGLMIFVSVELVNHKPCWFPLFSVRGNKISIKQVLSPNDINDGDDII